MTYITVGINLSPKKIEEGQEKNFTTGYKITRPMVRYMFDVFIAQYVYLWGPVPHGGHPGP